MNQRSENGANVPFRPNLRACVTEDVRLSRAVEDSYLDKLTSVAAYTYRSLVTEESDRLLSQMLDTFAIEEMEHFRLLGELIFALGGNPTVRTQVRVSSVEWKNERCREPERAIMQMLEEAVREEKQCVERLETLMGHTEDRVVRSLLAYLISDGQRHIVRLCDAMAG